MGDTDNDETMELVLNGQRGFSIISIPTSPPPIEATTDAAAVSDALFPKPIIVKGRGGGGQKRKTTTPRKRKSAAAATGVEGEEDENVEAVAVVSEVKTQEFRVQEDGELLEVVATPPKAKKPRRNTPKPWDITVANPSKKALATHVAAFCNKYGNTLVKKMEARQQASQMSLEELDSLIEEYGPEVKLSYTLPLMQWMRKTSLLIDSVAVMNKPMGGISEAITFTQAALQAADGGDRPEMVQAIRARFEHKWWKIPSYDYETIRELTSQKGSKARAILVGVTISTFPDSETGEPVECLMPQFRYYPEIITSNYSIVCGTSPERNQPFVPTTTNNFKRKVV